MFFLPQRLLTPLLFSLTACAALKCTRVDFSHFRFSSFSPPRSVTKHRPFTLLPSPLTLFPVLCSLALLTLKACKHTLTTSCPFPLSTCQYLCLSRLYRPSNVSFGTPSCSTLTDLPVFPSHSIGLLSLYLHGGEGGSCFGLLMSDPSPFLGLYFQPSRSLISHGGLIR